MRNMLLFPLLALAVTIPSVFRSEDSAADIPQGLNRGPAVAHWAPNPSSTNDGGAHDITAAASDEATGRNSITAHLMAARFISLFVDPKIREALAALPEKERPAAEAGFNPYKEELERTIVDYEEVEVTPEKAAAILRADKYVKPEQVTYFMERADALRASGVSDPAEVTKRAYLAMADRRDGRRMVSEEVVEDQFRHEVYRIERGGLNGKQLALVAAALGPNSGNIYKYTTLDYLLKVGAPRGLRFPSYGRMRHDIISSLATAPQQETRRAKDTPPKNTASAGIIPGEDDVRQAVAVLYETALRGTGQLNAGCSIATEPGCTVRTPGIAKTVYISSFKLLGCSPDKGDRLVCRFTVAFHCGLTALNSGSPGSLSNPFVRDLYCADFAGIPSNGQAYLVQTPNGWRILPERVPD